jgi:hypothetical protein
VFFYGSFKDRGFLVLIVSGASAPPDDLLIVLLRGADDATSFDDGRPCQLVKKWTPKIGPRAKVESAPG